MASSRSIDNSRFGDGVIINQGDTTNNHYDVPPPDPDAIASRIRSCLAIAQIEDRYNQIVEAHMDTFSWFFTSKDVQEPQTQAKRMFHQWLENESGILHLSGKLGCGKSTLMKFFVDHSGVKEKLKAWAGPDCKVVRGSFYFWRPGTSEQKSLAGLLRKLLHDVLKNEPALAEYALPDIWHQVSASWHANPRISITDKDVENALESVVRYCKTTRKFRLCFFIDGLDEFVETRSFDHLNMVHMLQRWTRDEPTANTIKICVSSREETIFMDHFSTDKRIRLHELTRHDMTNFASADLRHVFSPPVLNRNVTLIVDKAHGVFLWVSLVVKEIRRQFGNGYNIKSSSTAFLDLAPEDLTDLYRYILNSRLSPAERYRAHCTFAIMIMFVDGLDFDLNLWQFSFLPEYLGESRVPRVKIRRGDEAAAQLELSQATHYIHGWTRGLVEVTDSKNYDYSDQDSDCDADDFWNAGARLERKILRFAHRSIPDFWVTAEIQEEVRQIFRHHHFDVLDAVSQIVFRGIQYLDGSFMAVSLMPRHVLALVSLRAKSRLEADRQEPFRFLRDLDVIHDRWMAKYMRVGLRRYHLDLATYLAKLPNPIRDPRVSTDEVTNGGIWVPAATVSTRGYTDDMTEGTEERAGSFVVNSACQLLLEPEVHPYPFWVMAHTKLPPHAVPLMVSTALYILWRSDVVGQFRVPTAGAEECLQMISSSHKLKTLVINPQGYTVFQGEGEVAFEDPGVLVPYLGQFMACRVIDSVLCGIPINDGGWFFPWLPGRPTLIDDSFFTGFPDPALDLDSNTRARWAHYFGTVLKFALDTHIAIGKPEFRAHIRVKGPRLVAEPEGLDQVKPEFDFLADFSIDTGHKSHIELRLTSNTNIPCVYNIWATADDDDHTDSPCIVEYTWTIRDMVKGMA